MSFETNSIQLKNTRGTRHSDAWLRSDYLRLWFSLLALSLVIFLVSVRFSPIRPVASDWEGVALMTILAVVVSLLPVSLPGHGFSLSPITPIVFATVGLFGVTAGILVDVLSGLMQSQIMIPRTQRYRTRILFQSVALSTVPTGLSAIAYVLLQQRFFPHSGIGADESAHISAWLALSCCTIMASFLNAALNTMLASRYYNQRWDVIWHNNVRWMLPSVLLVSPIGFVLGLLYRSVPPWGPMLGIGFILFPVFAARLALVYHERTVAAYKQGVELLGRVMQEAHPYTHGHLHRVARWAKKIAEELKLPPESMQFIEDAAILHDIGKVAVDDRVLNKVGKLNDDDWAMIHSHPVVGADLVEGMSFMEKAAYWIRHHHERPDGKGYPSRLKGEEIPIESSIISVVDAFDAMVGGPAKEDQRPYRKPLSREAAVSELHKHAGTQFDARVVAAFVRVLERESEVGVVEERARQNRMEGDDSLWAMPSPTSSSAGALG